MMCRVHLQIAGSAADRTIFFELFLRPWAGSPKLFLDRDLGDLLAVRRQPFSPAALVHPAEPARGPVPHFETIRMAEERQWREWLAAVRQRDPVAQQDFWKQYAGRLLRLADANLQQSLRRRVDAEDVVQSAFRTFLRRVEDGQFELGDDQQLWSLLCAITLNKVRMQARFHSRHRRELDREAQAAGGDTSSDHREPSPAEAAMLVDLVQQMLDDAEDPQERSVLRLKLKEHSNDEISEQLRCSERTVRRMMKRIRSRLERMLAAE
jgi:RNA polymerase sigma factor (sigma-70 family)